MKYQNKRTGVMAELVQESEKFKTVYLVKEDGTDTTISISTFKRWWKAVPEEEMTTEDPVDEEVASDGTPYSQVMQEIIQDGKQAVEEATSTSVEEDTVNTAKELAAMAVEEPKQQKKKTSKKAAKKDTEVLDKMFDKVMELLQFSSKVTGIRTRGTRYVSVKVNDKPLFEVKVSTKGNVLYMKEQTAQDMKLSYTTIHNYYLPAVVKDLGDVEYTKIIKNLIEGGK